MPSVANVLPNNKPELNIQIKTFNLGQMSDTVSPIRPNNGGNMSEFELLAQDLLEKAEAKNNRDRKMIKSCRGRCWKL